MIYKKIILLNIFVFSTFITAGQPAITGDSYFTGMRNDITNFCKEHPILTSCTMAGLPLGIAAASYWWKKNNIDKSQEIIQKPIINNHQEEDKNFERISFKQRIFDFEEAQFWTDERKDQRFVNTKYIKDEDQEKEHAINLANHLSVIVDIKGPNVIIIPVDIKQHTCDISRDQTKINNYNSELSKLIKKQQNIVNEILKKPAIFENMELFHIPHSKETSLGNQKEIQKNILDTIKRTITNFKNLFYATEHTNKNDEIYSEKNEIQKNILESIQKTLNNFKEHIENNPEKYCAACKKDLADALKKIIQDYKDNVKKSWDMLADMQSSCSALTVKKMIERFETVNLKDFSSCPINDGQDSSRWIYKRLGLTRQEWIDKNHHEIQQLCNEFNTLYDNTTQQGKFIRQIEVLCRSKYGKKLYDAYLDYLASGNQDISKFQELWYPFDGEYYKTIENMLTYLQEIQMTLEDNMRAIDNFKKSIK